MKIENHPVGFRKYVLLAVAGFRLRLHVWQGGAGNDSRHNHRWWFISIPILGYFVETRYAEYSGSSWIKIDVLDRDNQRDGDRAYLAKGRSDLEIKVRRIRRPLLPYYCPADAIHSLVPRGSGIHVSLVFCGRLRSENSEIWRAPDNVDVALDETDPRLPRSKD